MEPVVMYQYCGECQCEYKVQRIKRAEESRPQNRKDTGPSLANIGLHVHQLVKIPVHL